MPIYPNLSLEKKLWRQGLNNVAGIDEAGMGAWAGPLAVGAVILPRDFKLKGIKDSKKLSPKKREFYFEKITKISISYSIVLISEKDIDRLGLAKARLKGINLVIKNLKTKADFLLLDGLKIKNMRFPYKAIIKGDEKIKSIACASIIAKVKRDNFLKKLHLKYPEYGFNSHKGYGTEKHQRALKNHGPCQIHRRSYAPVKEYISNSEFKV